MVTTSQKLLESLSYLWNVILFMKAIEVSEKEVVIYYFLFWDSLNYPFVAEIYRLGK